jgi:hypothetical protein
VDVKNKVENMKQSVLVAESVLDKEPGGIDIGFTSWFRNLKK